MKYTPGTAGSKIRVNTRPPTAEPISKVPAHKGNSSVDYNSGVSAILNIKEGPNSRKVNGT